MLDDFSQLINLNKKLVSQNNKIINQNNEIIGLLKNIANESENEEIQDDMSLLENEALIGEVYFIEEDDIFKLSIKNNECMVNNLTSSSEANDYKVQELIANESVKNNMKIPESTVILNESQSTNLAKTLKICVENGASNVFIPWSGMSQLIGAPQVLMTLLKLDFYKNTDELIKKVFDK